MTSDNHPIGFNSSDISTSQHHSKSQYDDFKDGKESLKETNNNDNVQRTVLVQHRFHADIKQTYIRWIRETPV
ncbi:hypothetical protein I4U23_009975 [Adineta vaga]|nr:hypothetical protein I4U23_009975 [Adineta vaga]